MYEIVKTYRQQKKFENTWEYFCEKYGWYNDPYAKNGVRYNLLLPMGNSIRQKEVIGTIEFIPYDPRNPNSTVEGPSRFEFSKYDEIRLHQNRIWEIDKLCIHKEYQRQGYFQHFMHVFYDHANRNNPKYYLALIEKKLFRMLRISFGFRVEQKGEAYVGPNTVLIPVVFDIEKMMQDEETVKTILATTQSFQEYNVRKSHSKMSVIHQDQSNKISFFKKLFGR
ncbi:hypothetical protein ELQ35_06815 [Peribacillus cavernae]|uniref:GNAT family N-acetyltransferase n=1 Tax=Peribacillus cavernae TaxID=1674310 RepID=A0A3S1B7P1_9BACI|nr:hypothetical protein [Peribacillus cavernae]MDQ0217501.1 hypothetical protein [Peribacillus cavernae]RUQ30059.1 hypothetical protein ELQ35_06815 [Peribacillus cavernae]